jgi:hypothetical protein
MKPDRRPFLVPVSIATGFALLMSGCAGSQGYWVGAMWTPGIIGGFFHGFIAPLALGPWLVAKLFAWIFHGMGWYGGLAWWLDDFQLYASRHEDGYGWGYLFGIGLCMLIGNSSDSRT